MNNHTYPLHTRAFTGSDAAAPPPEIGAAPSGSADQPVGEVPERHAAGIRFRVRHFHDTVPSAPGAGAVIHNREELGFEAKTAIFCNTSGSTMQIGGSDLRVPAGIVNLVVALRPYVDHYLANVFASAAGAGELDVILTEEDLPPTPWFSISAALPGSVTITSPIGQTTMAASVAVTLASNQTPTIGPANFNSIVATLPSAAVGARATRVSGFIRARKANVADIVVGGGIHLQAGDSINISTTSALTTTGTAGDIFDFYEEFN